MTADPRALAAELKANANPGVGIAHEFNCTHDPCRCVDGELRRLRSIVAPLHDAWVATKPPCQTCGGSGVLCICSRCGCRANGDRCDNCGGPTEGGNCPTCPGSPGVRPFAEWVAGVIAVWVAVHDPELEMDVDPPASIPGDHIWVFDRGVATTLRHLRQIGSPR